MIQVGATLNRAVQFAHDASALQVALPSPDGVPRDDEDLLDDWLASMSVVEFEHCLSRLAELR
jgi:hypothetical protein